MTKFKQGDWVALTVKNLEPVITQVLYVNIRNSRGNIGLWYFDGTRMDIMRVPVPDPTRNIEKMHRIVALLLKPSGWQTIPDALLEYYKEHI